MSDEKVAMSIIENTLSPEAFWQVNKRITHFVGCRDAALLLSDLVGRRHYFRSRDMLDASGGFFVLSEEIESDLLMNKRTRVAATKLLIEKGLLALEPKKTNVVNKGFQTVNFYYIQDVAITGVLGAVGANLSPRGVQKCTANKNILLPPQEGDPKESLLPDNSYIPKNTLPNNSHSIPENYSLPEEGGSFMGTLPESQNHASGAENGDGPCRTIPKAEIVIQRYLSAMGSFDYLKDRKRRQDALAGLVQEFKQSGFSESATLSAFTSLIQYAVPSETSTKKAKVIAEWKSDLKRQWEITIKSEYAPIVQPPRADRIYGETKPVNKEALDFDITTVMK